MEPATSVRAALVAAGCLLALACTGGPGSPGTWTAPDHGSVRHDAGTAPDVAAVDTGATDVPTPTDAPSTPDVEPPRPGASCDAPIRLSPTGVHVRTASTRDGGHPVVQACLPGPSAQVFFAFDAPPNRRVVFTAVPFAPDFRLAARMVIECGADACIDSDASPIGGAPAVVGYSNDTPELRHKVVAVSSAIAGMEGGFVASLRDEPLPEGPPPPDGATCAHARDLDPGAILQDQFVASDPDGADACPAPGTTQRFYRVTVPPRSRVVVSARSVLESELIWRPQLRVLDGCMTPRCISVDRSPTGEVSFTPALLENLDDDPRTFIVSVASPSPSSAGAKVYSVDAVLQALPMPAANATCDTATLLPVVPGRITLDGSTANATDAGRVCSGAPSSWKVLFYAADVPPGDTLTVTLRGSYDRVRMRQDCSATTCLGEASTTEDSGPRQVVYANHGGATQRVILEVGNNRAPSGTFSLVLDLTPSP